MSKVLVPLAEGCEELEAVTIIDLLRRAGIEVVVASLKERTVICSRGVSILAEIELNSILADEFEMIVLPGGLPGADHLMNDERIQSLLKRSIKNKKYVAAICAAPRALAAAGLLENRKATSYPGALDDMNITGLDYKQQAVVEDGLVITSRGPGTAMDFGLHLIEVLQGKAKRDEVELSLQRR